MALRVGIALGATPIGAPIIGWVANHLGSRLALGIGAASGFAAAIVGVHAMTQKRHRQEAPATGASQKTYCVNQRGTGTHYQCGENQSGTNTAFVLP